MAKTVTIYGIKACDTMKKAFTWLEANNIPYQFHDYKKAGLDADTLQGWCSKVGYEPLLNTRGTTWRKLSDAERANIDQSKAQKLMLNNLSLIKRPVVVSGKTILVGFDPEKWQQQLG